MKRGKLVINKADVKVGRRMALWVSTGMKFGPGEYRDSLVASGQKALSMGTAALARLGAEFLAIEAQEIRVGAARPRGKGAPASCWWRTPAGEIVARFVGQ